MAKKLTLTIITIILIWSFTSFTVFADQDGKGDGDYACAGCHKDGGSATIDISTIQETMEGGQSTDLIISVNADSINDDDYIVGVMLLTGSDDNIKDNGWSIASDPNGNDSPFNYNEMTGVSGDTDFSWTLIAPSTAGDYDVKTRIIFGGDDANFLDSDVKTVTVTSSSTDDGAEDAEEGVDLEALKLGLLVGLMALVSVMILKKRW